MLISIHALLAESDLPWHRPVWISSTFLSTLSLRRATFRRESPHAGHHFYPRSPCGERRIGGADYHRNQHFYPRSPCGERLAELSDIFNANQISIHALLAESDPPCCKPLLPTCHFYPRSPCGERHWRMAAVAGCDLFLSTLSLRRATIPSRLMRRMHGNFYPRSPCGERLLISGGPLFRPCYFYPRSPCGERLTMVSTTHALLDFYPRSPCGERLGGYRQRLYPRRFLSTLSLRRATGQRTRPHILH